MMKKMKKKKNWNKLVGTASNYLLIWLLIWKEMESTQLPLGWKERKQDDIKTELVGEVMIEGSIMYRLSSDRAGTNDIMDGRRAQVCLLVGKQRVCYVWKVNGKMRNRRTKMEHGNGSVRQNISIIHWNMGARMWERKIQEIEAVILQLNPDIFSISEANLKDELTGSERNIQGYRIYLPKSSVEHPISRIAVLVRDGLEVELVDKYMDDIVSAVWLKIGISGRKPVLLGNIYREHRYWNRTEAD